MKNFNFRIFIISFLAITGLFLGILYLFAACQQRTSKISDKFDSRSMWLLRNEEALNSELNKRIIKAFTDDFIPQKKNEKIIDATIVVTKYDETILGQFAQLINNYDSCVVISYTFSSDTLDRKIIGFFKDTTKSCVENADTFMTVNSTKWFTIRKRPLFEVLK